MVKIADSATMRPAIATLPRSGRLQVAGACENGFASALIAFFLYLRLLSSFVRLFILAVWIFGMLQVPQRPPARNHWDGSKVIRRRRGACRPFECPGVPGVIARLL